MMKDIYVHPTAEVSAQAKIGNGTKVWHFAQIRENAEIGENCIIGKGVYIDHDVRIGNAVKIQNGISVYYGVTIEDDVILAPNATFTNDLYPRAFSEHWQVVPTLIKRGASVGANATIVCGVTLGEYCMIAAGAVVAKNVPAHALIIGNPGRQRGLVCKCGRRVGYEELGFIDDYDFEVELNCKHCQQKIRINTDLYRV